MPHDDVNDLKQRVTNQSVQIMRLEERVRSLTKERDHWVAEAADARALSSRLFEKARSSAAERMFSEPKAEDSTRQLVHGEWVRATPLAYPQSWWQRVIGRLFA